MTVRARILAGSREAVGSFAADAGIAAPFVEQVHAAFDVVLASIEGATDPTATAEALARAGVPAQRSGSSILLLADGRARDLLAREHRALLDALDLGLRHRANPRSDLALPGRPPLPLGERTHVMGIVNVTPDSFSDGGRYLDADAAVKHGARLVQEGADLLDIGGESTRPGAEPVDASEEIERVVPVIEGLSAMVDVPISIDTTKASVAEAALDAGATIVNDVSAGRFDPQIMALAAERGAPLVLMHMLGEPRTMQQDPRYDDVVGDIWRFLAERADAALEAGVSADRIVVDPGFGFGKTREQNLLLLSRLREFACLGYPVLVGTSRKMFIGATLDLPVGERLEGTAATVAVAVSNGASIVRVHDVGPMRRVAGMVEAVTTATATTEGTR